MIYSIIAGDVNAEIYIAQDCLVLICLKSSKSIRDVSHIMSIKDGFTIKLTLSKLNM